MERHAPSAWMLHQQLSSVTGRILIAFPAHPYHPGIEPGLFGSSSPELPFPQWEPAYWRSLQDSDLRCIPALWFSRPVLSATQPRLHLCCIFRHILNLIPDDLAVHECISRCFISGADNQNRTDIRCLQGNCSTVEPYRHEQGILAIADWLCPALIFIRLLL